VFIQIRRVGKGGQGTALGAVGWQQDDLAIASFHVGREDRRRAAPRHRLAEDQVPVGKIDLYVFFDDPQVAHPIALVAVEAVLAYGACDIGCRPAKNRKGKQPRQSQELAHHAPSLPKWEGKSGGKPGTDGTASEFPAKRRRKSMAVSSAP
jgi:hypothetical protein